MHSTSHPKHYYWEESTRKNVDPFDCTDWRTLTVCQSAHHCSESWALRAITGCVGVVLVLCCAVEDRLTNASQRRPLPTSDCLSDSTNYLTICAFNSLLRLEHSHNNSGGKWTFSTVPELWLCCAMLSLGSGEQRKWALGSSKGALLTEHWSMARTVGLTTVAECGVFAVKWNAIQLSVQLTAQEIGSRFPTKDN